MNHKERAEKIIADWQRNPGMAGEPDLQTRIETAFREVEADAFERAANRVEHWIEIEYLGCEGDILAAEIRALKEPQ